MAEWAREEEGRERGWGCTSERAGAIAGMKRDDALPCRETSDRLPLAEAVSLEGGRGLAVLDWSRETHRH